MEFQKKERYTLCDLIAIMKILRAPGGCPWDREQTHRSIRKNMIEEAYEVVDAIDREDPAALQEELGDVLMQVVFHAEMETEHGGFTFDDVADGICKKLVYRHPHVFGDVSARTSEQVLKNWEALKRVEKSQKTVSESMDSIPRQLPALMRGTKLRQKAARAGLDKCGLSGALDQAEEMLASLRADEHAENAAETLGDLLFALAGVSQYLQVDAEEALTGAGDRFVRRFTALEQLAKELGVDLAGIPKAQLDDLWKRAGSSEPKKS